MTHRVRSRRDPLRDVCWYLPRPLQQRNPRKWINPVTMVLSDLADPRLADGIAMGRAVIGRSRIHRRLRT